MRGIIRIFLYTAILLFFLAAAGWFLKDSIYSFFLSNTVKVSLSLSSVKKTDVGLKITVLKIPSPKPFKKKIAFIAQEAEIIYSPLEKKKNGLSKIEMHDVSINIECENSICTQNNWAMLINDIEKKEKRNKRPPVEIDEVILRNVDISLNHSVGKEEKFHFDRIDFNALKSQNGFPTEQIIVALFREANLKEYLPEREGLFKELFNRIKNLFEE